MDPVRWREAWQEALYGDRGFYRQPEGPAGHFATATHGVAGTVLAHALWAWADRLGADGIVDIGAGRGELVAHLRAAAPHRPVTGVDVVPRPDLPGDVGWLRGPGGAALPEELAPRGALVVAHEWLDVVPCTIAQVAADRSLREVLVDPRDGTESLGPPLGDADLRWCGRFWPPALAEVAAPGDRVEVGRQRDEAWAGLLDRMEGGAAIAVDYGHTAGDRPREGTLTAYRRGVLVRPVPDGSCDLTAHVAVDSLRHDELLTQREALHVVGVSGQTPDHALARADPVGYLGGLARAAAASSLCARGGLGDFMWVVARGAQPGRAGSRS